MSNVGTRQRRTVPLDDDLEIGDHSVPTEENSIRSSAHARTRPLNSPSVSSRSGSRSSSRSGRKRHDKSLSSRELAPMRQSFLNGRDSGHSRESTSTAPSITVEELKRSFKRKSSKNGSNPGLKTPSTESNRLTIGNSSILSASRSRWQATQTATSSSITPLSALPDLFSLEQALQDCGEEDFNNSIGRLMERPERQSSITRTPAAWKTPFEVDAPRETPNKNPKPPSPVYSFVSEPDPQLSEEQDVWAGIDSLLESEGSLDDSCCFSTSDILPVATVRAMRGDLKSLEEGSDDEEESIGTEGGCSRTSKRSSGSISKNSGSSSETSTRKGRSKRKPKTAGTEVDMPSLVDSSVSGEVDDKVGELVSDNTRGHGRALPGNRGVGAATSGGGLFDMFHWSEKANVDELRGKKKKLNQTRLKVKLMTNSDHGSSNYGSSNHESDNASLPSLASFRDDEMSTRSRGSTAGWESFHAKDHGSVVSEDSVKEFALDEEDQFEFDEPDTGENPVQQTPVALAGDGLVLDKGVDEYIRQIQQKLPSIAEDTSVKGAQKDKHVGFVDETSPSPISVVEDYSAFDQLPSLASLADEKVTRSPPSPRGGARKELKMEEKKEPKPSLSLQLMNSIKKMRSKVKVTRKSLANGDEDKYFPDEAKPEKSSRFSANRCLLNEGDDGVNWD